MNVRYLRSVARLFITERELNFISDLTKEIIKDVNGQVIIYYPISELKTLAHEVYNEAVQKVFDNPIKIDALVSATSQEDTHIGPFGPDERYKIEVYIQYRDLVEKGINISIGDIFSFSTVFYEITQAITPKQIWGLAEHRQGVKIVGNRVRESQFKTRPIGPTDIAYADADAVQKEFHQQRGISENADGLTGDVRDLVKNGTLDSPLSGQREVSERGGESDASTAGSAFYDE